jgi:hypothetical protein
MSDVSNSYRSFCLHCQDPLIICEDDNLDAEDFDYDETLFCSENCYYEFSRERLDGIFTTKRRTSKC